jgi:hypothetical protein
MTDCYQCRTSFPPSQMDLTGIKAFCLSCVPIIERQDYVKGTELCHLCSFRHKPKDMHSRGCCANCWSIEVELSEWADRCFEESFKPVEQQNERVFFGQF